MIEALITGAVAIIVCMVNNSYQQKAAREQHDKTTALIDYRLKQLEEEVKKHNNFAQRMPVLEEKIEVANHRIADLEEKEK